MKLSMRRTAFIACLLFPSWASTQVWAADATHNIQIIREAGAQQVMMAAEREADKLHAPCAIAVVDTRGTLVAFVKMDGVRDGSPELAINKARTSALLQRPSEETEENIDNGRISFVTAGFTSLRGGVPLMANGEVVGAVGVAGLDKDNDVTTAQTAAAAFRSGSNSHP